MHLSILILLGLVLAACGGDGKKPPLVPDDPNAPSVIFDGGNEEAGW
jgi:hypothetical protein